MLVFAAIVFSTSSFDALSAILSRGSRINHPSGIRTQRIMVLCVDIRTSKTTVYFGANFIM